MSSYIGTRASIRAAESIFPCNNYFCKCIEYLDFGRLYLAYNNSICTV